MRIIDNLDEMTETARGWLASGRVGFIPISSSLHEGHCTLIRAAHDLSDIRVVSIIDKQHFFYAQQPVVSLPHDINKDICLLQEADIDLVFIPKVHDFYPVGFSHYVTPTGALATQLENTVYSISNPANLPKFATTMVKLFQLIRPDIAFLGQKDALQAAIIRQLILDFNIDVSLYIHRTVREDDGLAISGRNQLLSRAQRHAAPLLYQTLLNAKMLVSAGERRATLIKKAMMDCVASNPYIKLEYITICHPESFISHNHVVPGTLIAMGARLGSVRLNDNILWMKNGKWSI